MATLKKNGKAYDGADVVITLLGNSPNEVSEISYDEDTDHQNNYSLGSRDPSSWSMGNHNPVGSITMSMREIVSIENGIPGNNKRLPYVRPFDIIVQYRNDYNQLVTDIVTCKFKNQGREAKAGDMGLGKQLDLHVLGIQFNVRAA